MAAYPEPGLEGLLSDAAGLPAGPCKTCEREVLAHLIAAEPQGVGDAAASRRGASDQGDGERGARDEEDPLGAERNDETYWACVHCGTRLRRVFWVDEEDLSRLGYSLTDPTALAGCGTGCGRGCSAGPRVDAVPRPGERQAKPS